MLLSVTPSIALGFHLEPDLEEFHTAVKWWLGLDILYGSQCALSPGSSLALGYHATTCKRGGDAIFCHNKFRGVWENDRVNIVRLNLGVCCAP